MPPINQQPISQLSIDQPPIQAPIQPPVNNTRMIILLSAAIVIIGIAAGVKIEQTIRSSMPGPSFTVIPSVPIKSSLLPLQDIASSSPPEISALIPSQYKAEAPQIVNQITARAYIIGNAMTGHVYMSSNSTAVLPVASMSKLITTIAATDTMSPTTTITITPEESNVPPDSSNLTAGETFTLKELLYPLLLNSSNVAAEAIASSSDRAAFLDLMSSYAWEVGMPTAFFADPSGIDPGNHASAADMLALARYLYVYRPDILALTRIVHEGVATTSDHGGHIFDSIHPFVNDPRFIGGKTGRTPEAGETMMTILRIDSQPIVFIVMGSYYGRRESDTDLLIQKFEAAQN
jgi:D-alanyl-D-alanine carboxypeptidase